MIFEEFRGHRNCNQLYRQHPEDAQRCENEFDQMEIQLDSDQQPLASLRCTSTKIILRRLQDELKEKGGLAERQYGYNIIYNFHREDLL